MLINSVIIILREVLEAALLFSVLLALSKLMIIQRKWLIGSILLGSLGAILYAYNMATVSDWYEGVGQEVINATLQFAIYILLVFFIVCVLWQYRYQQLALAPQSSSFLLSKALLIFLMLTITSLAIIREGSEILLYFFSATHNKNYFISVLMGMIIGASIGISIGCLFYYLLVNISAQWNMITGLLLLILVSSGMLSQATLLLIQADWLPAYLPLWDTNDWLSENSVTGQLMYALMGYEATPTIIQVSFYLGGFMLPLLLIIFINNYLIRVQSLNKTLENL
jgi:high-affinity iron transporter